MGNGHTSRGGRGNNRRSRNGPQKQRGSQQQQQQQQSSQAKATTASLVSPISRSQVAQEPRQAHDISAEAPVEVESQVESQVERQVERQADEEGAPAEHGEVPADADEAEPHAEEPEAVAAPSPDEPHPQRARPEKAASQPRPEQRGPQLVLPSAGDGSPAPDVTVDQQEPKQPAPVRPMSRMTGYIPGQPRPRTGPLNGQGAAAGPNGVSNGHGGHTNGRAPAARETPPGTNGASGAANVAGGAAEPQHPRFVVTERPAQAEHRERPEHSERSDADYEPSPRDVRGEVGALIDALRALFVRDRAVASQGGTTRCGICYLHFTLPELEYRQAEGFYVCADCAHALRGGALPMVRRQQRA
jgi:hypothetical protein